MFTPDIAASCDYGAAAELFPPRAPSARGLRGLSYQRFTSASAAIQFAIEKLPLAILRNTFLQIGDERYNHLDIRRLYDSLEYPNARAKSALTQSVSHNR